VAFEEAAAYHGPAKNSGSQRPLLRFRQSHPNHLRFRVRDIRPGVGHQRSPGSERPCEKTGACETEPAPLPQPSASPRGLNLPPQTGWKRAKTDDAMAKAPRKIEAKSPPTSERKPRALGRAPLAAAQGMGRTRSRARQVRNATRSGRPALKQPKMTPKQPHAMNDKTTTPQRKEPKEIQRLPQAGGKPASPRRKQLKARPRAASPRKSRRNTCIRNCRARQSGRMRAARRYLWAARPVVISEKPLDEQSFKFAIIPYV
jgi:hypothetical protein